MSTFAEGTVESVSRWTAGAALAEVVMGDGKRAEAMVYPPLVGTVSPGDRVILNTTAVELGLGSGGYHFVLWNLSRTGLDTGASGHIMKMRYTPLQLNSRAVEEDLPEMSPDELSRVLEGIPVIAGSLHSQLLPAALAYKNARPRDRLVYLMTDGGSLPAAFSSTADFLRREGVTEATVSCGQAFGGDLEAVNVYGGLAGARRVCGADAVVAVMGPGIAGTGSALGFSGLEQAGVINAAGSLGGRPVAAARITFADPRERHRGLSHHTITVLRHAALARAVVPIPMMEADKRALVEGQLSRAGVYGRHEVVEVDASGVIGLLEECPLEATVMGRGVTEEPEYFKAAGAAGVAAAGVGHTGAPGRGGDSEE